MQSHSQHRASQLKKCEILIRIIVVCKLFYQMKEPAVIYTAHTWMIRVLREWLCSRGLLTASCCHASQVLPKWQLAQVWCQHLCSLAVSISVSIISDWTVLSLRGMGYRVCVCKRVKQFSHGKAMSWYLTIWLWSSSADLIFLLITLYYNVLLSVTCT